MIRMLFALFAVGLVGCTTVSNTTSVSPRPPFAEKIVVSDESQIEVTVCKYLISNLLNVSLETPIFVRLRDHEIVLLRSSITNHIIEPISNASYDHGSGVRDKRSKIKGVALFLVPEKRDGNTAKVICICTTLGEVSYDFDLEKDGEWKVLRATQLSIADP
jgi:hypothetical protein